MPAPASRLTLRKKRPAYDWYVDSVSGSDANPGTSESFPLATVAALQAMVIKDGDRVGFRRGGSWKETFNVTANNLTIGCYGPDALPLPYFDGADTATGWTALGGATPNVYSISWTKTTIADPTEYLFIWANGVLISRFGSSAADVQANGGWWASTARTASPATVYIFSATDPNTSGVLYEITRRSYAISGHNSTIGKYFFGCVVSNLEGTRFIGHYNAFAQGNGNLSRALARFGNIHHVVTEAESGTDIVCTDMPIGYPSSYIPYTGYTDKGAGRSHLARRVIVVGDTSPTNQQGLYFHNSTSPWDSITLEQCCNSDADVGCACAFANFTVRGFYAHAVGGSVNASGNTFTCTHLLHNTGATAIGDGGPADTTVRARVVQHCAAYLLTADLGPAVNVAIRAGTLSFTNCVIVVDSAPIGLSVTPTGSGISVTVNNCVFVWRGTPTTPLAMSLSLGGGTYTGNNNVFVLPNVAATTVRNAIGGTTYTGLAAWQAATGQDANSVVLAADSFLLYKLFQNGPNGLLCGDFRMKTGAYFLADATTDIATACGPQEKWDWGLRINVAGAPKRWPIPPANAAQGRTYVNGPDGWQFYPADASPPTPGTIGGTSTNSGSYTITYTAGSKTDLSGATYAPDAYVVENGVEVAGPAIASPVTVTGRTNGTAYTVSIRYKDVSGNHADTSTTSVTPNIPTVDPLLDDFPGAAVAYSTRQLRTAYAGSALRVRRSSDSTQQDIGFTGTPGQLDTASLLAFVGAGDGFVTKWYDQSGNANDAVQATTTLQQKIVSSGVVNLAGTKPAILGDGTAGHNLVSGNMGLTQPITLFTRAANTRSTSNFDSVAGLYTSGGTAVYSEQVTAQTSTTMSVQWGGATSTVQPKDAIFSGLANGASSKYSVNGGSVQNAAGGSTTTPDGAVRMFNPWLGLIGESIVYGSDQTSNRAGIIANMDAHWAVY